MGINDVEKFKTGLLGYEVLKNKLPDCALIGLGKVLTYKKLLI